MSTRAQVNDALQQLVGQTLAAAIVIGSDQDGPIEALLIETTEGQAVRLETRHGIHESWLEIA